MVNHLNVCDRVLCVPGGWANTAGGGIVWWLLQSPRAALRAVRDRVTKGSYFLRLYDQGQDQKHREMVNKALRNHCTPMTSSGLILPAF